MGASQTSADVRARRSPDALPLPGCAGSDHYALVERLLRGVTGAAETHHGVALTQHRTANGARQLLYKWPTVSAYWQYQAAYEINGDEEFPGRFRDPGVVVDWAQNSCHQHLQKLLEPEKADHLLNCLVTHYFNAYSTEADRAARKSNNGRHVAPFVGISSSFDMFKTLDMGGQTFGSEFAAQGRDRRVVVYFNRDKTEKWDPLFGHVRFYLTHNFFLPGRGLVQHTFAFVRWLAHSNQQPFSALNKGQPHSPYLNPKFLTDKSVGDLVCVHRIVGKWIECVRERHANGQIKVIQALRIPYKNKLHC